MPVDETFTDDLSVTQGNPTKASEYTNLSNNTDALKQRLEMDHWFNNTGVTNEDGHHKGDWDDPMWIYARDQGPAYVALWVRNNGGNFEVWIKGSTDKTAPTGATDGEMISTSKPTGEGGFNDEI